MIKENLHETLTAAEGLGSGPCDCMVHIFFGDWDTHRRSFGDDEKTRIEDEDLATWRLVS
jgi:hypothetical protein